MKCIKAVITHKEFKSGQIIRVDDNEAFKLVQYGKWVYCPKWEWKAQEHLKNKQQEK